ncbi:hypothetical protein KVR01_009621 [Diaporthe batatas]|uniref:uncharacterized protein n=1 Tax=Diaporthe batatas TaxID=748121 RepID=UPI001D052835|nr:uncharacterized protein KVR01_009621 [Diaporthe batatas]KAG8161357.1 hypothetical protein KVR01_009621 [Diaporthe batatas]
MEGDAARYGSDPRNQTKNPDIFIVDEIAGTTHWDLNMTPTETNALRGHSADTNAEMETRWVEGTTVIHGAQPTNSTIDIDPPRPAVVTNNDYSDLPEVVEAIPPLWDLADDKMPVIIDAGSEKIAAMEGHGQMPASLLSPSIADPVPAYPHPRSLMSRSSNLSTMPLTGDRSMPSSPFYDKMQIQDEESREVKVCGMGSRMFMCVAISLLCFVLVLLATVLGVTLTMKGQRSSSSSSSVPQNYFAILNNTQLAAVNWTDTTGVARSALFYQDSESSILVSLRDSISNNWYYSNVTQAVLNMTGADELDVLAGTPLAAVTNSYQVSLYYLTNDNLVAEIWASDIVGEVWFAGELGTRLAPQAMEGSKLSAYWQICDNCTNSLFLTYQEPSGSIQLCNLTNNTWSYAGPVGTELSMNGTGLSLRPFTDNDGIGQYGTMDNALRVYHFDNSGKLQEIMNGPETNFTWMDGSSDVSISSAAAMVNPSPDLVSVSYGDHGWTNMMVTFLASDGTLTSSFWNESAWTAGAPTLSGGPAGSTNFTAIATTQNRMIYGLSEVGIFEYHFDDNNPLNWIFTSDVAIS